MKPSQKILHDINTARDRRARLKKWKPFLLAAVFVAGSLAGLMLSGCTSTPKPAVPPAAEPTPDPVAELPTFELDRLAWGNADWDMMLYSALYAHREAFKKAKDLSRICSNADAMDEQERLQMLGHFFVGIAKFESSYRPTTSYTETTMGIDPVTGRQVVSEGHFQLSYQDEMWAKCGISYPKRNIQKPEINIPCAVKIMAGHAAGKYNEVFLMSPYWSVIRDGDRFTENFTATDKTRYCAWQDGKCRYTKLPAVVAEVKKNMAGCK